MKMASYSALMLALACSVSAHAEIFEQYDVRIESRDENRNTPVPQSPRGKPWRCSLWVSSDLSRTEFDADLKGVTSPRKETFVSEEFGLQDTHRFETALKIIPRGSQRAFTIAEYCSSPYWSVQRALNDTTSPFTRVNRSDVVHAKYRCHLEGKSLSRGDRASATCKLESIARDDSYATKDYLLNRSLDVELTRQANVVHTLASNCDPTSLGSPVYLEVKGGLRPRRSSENDFVLKLTSDSNMPAVMHSETGRFNGTVKLCVANPGAECMSLQYQATEADILLADHYEANSSSIQLCKGKSKTLTLVRPGIPYIQTPTISKIQILWPSQP